MKKVLFEDGFKRFNIGEVVEEFRKFWKEYPLVPYCLIVASDSQPHKTYVQYATSVILHRIGKGGTFFVKREKKAGNPGMHSRIWEEAQRSVLMAQLILPALQEAIGKDGTVEIHVDTSPKGKTRSMIRAITGYIEAEGFTARVKPNAPGVRVADRFSK